VPPARVVIVEDNRLFRETLELLLALREEIDVVGSVDEYAVVIAAVHRAPPAPKETVMGRALGRISRFGPPGPGQDGVVQPHAGTRRAPSPRVGEGRR